MTHELKIWPANFAGVLDGTRTFEIRIHDRAFAAGDILRLKEYELSGKRFTGRETTVRVTCLLESAAIIPGYCVMGIVPATDKPASQGQGPEQLIDCIRQLADGVRKESASRQYERFDRFGEKPISTNV